MEFLATEDGEFFFLEMNTRLQVEHPVTECTTGLDLVALQIQVADGGTLPAEPPAIQGHSIEARLYAENPAAGWQPQSGTVRRFDIPGATAEFHLPGHPGRNGVRLDSMIETGAEVEGRPLRGSTVSVHYDPMLAKVITVAPTRTEAARLLASTLERARIHGLTTNRDLLVNVLRHPAFLDGDTDTSFLDKHGLDTLARPLANKPHISIRPSPPRWPMPPRTGPRRWPAPPSRAAGATCEARLRVSRPRNSWPVTAPCASDTA